MENLKYKNPYSQIDLISHDFALFSMFGFVLAIILLINVHQALALSISMPIGTAAGRPLASGGSVPLTSTAPTIPVTFSFIATRPSTEHSILQFRCIWDGQVFTAPPNCSIPSEAATTTGTTTLYTSSGTATRPLGLGDHSFSVQVVSSATVNPRISTANFGTFTITSAATPNPVVPSWNPPTEICGDGVDNNRNGEIDEDPCPKVKIHVHDLNGMDVSYRRTSYQGFFTLYEVAGHMLDRYCHTGLLSGPIPSNNAYDRQRFSTCVTIPDRVLGGEAGSGLNYISSRVNPGTYSYCAVVFDASNRRSNVSCTQWEIVRGNSPDLSPTTRINEAESGGIYAGTWGALPDGGRTPYHGIHFVTRAVPPTGSGGSTQEAYFDCMWDYGWFRQCGFRVDAQTSLIIPPGRVGDGLHYLEVRAWYPGSSSIGPSAWFTWCVVSPTSPCGPGVDTISNPIYSSMSPGGMSPSGAGTNGSFIINDAGPNKIVVENEKVLLSGTMNKVNDGIFDNKSKADVKSFSWRQTEGPKVKLNSTETQEVEFIAPSVKNDTILKFNFMVTDSKGINATDTTSVLLITKGNTQIYNGSFCDAMVAKTLDYINNTKNMSEDSNIKDKTGTNMKQATKFLNECQEPLDQYAKQLGNISRIFPTVDKTNVTITSENVHNFTGINPTNPIN